MNTTSSVKVDTFFSQFKHQMYKKGEIIIRADDSPLGIFYLLKGKVKMYAISKKGEETVITIFKPGSFFPISWIINNSVNNYYFETVTTIEVRRASPDKVLTFLRQESDVLFDLLQRVFTGLEGMTERMMYLMGGSAYERLLVELIIGVKRFGTKVIQDHTQHLMLKISEKELAAQTGLSRETISREMKHLKEKKLVVYSKAKLLVSDLEALKNELAQAS